MTLSASFKLVPANIGRQSKLQPQLCEVSQLCSQLNNQKTKEIKVDKVATRMLPTATRMSP